MLTVTFSSFPHLQTPRLTLREITLDDTAAIFAIRSDERVMQHIGRPVQTEMAEAQQWIEVIQQGYGQNESITWGICLKDQPSLIGTIGFWKMDKANHRTEIGYMLHADYWRQGIMDEAIKAAMEYCFKEMNFHSVEANTAPENEASGRILEKHGFKVEAYFRENFYFNGQFLDSRVYGIVNPYHKSA